MLTATRGGASWEAAGHAVAAYEAALTYAGQREQFGKPIAGYQLVQNKLANMLAEVTTIQLMCFRMAQLQEQGKLTGPMASLAKMYTAQKARGICMEARDILGGNGLLLDYHVATAHDRHGGRAHLRGHRQHPVPDHRPGRHRPVRVRLTCHDHRNDHHDASSGADDRCRSGPGQLHPDVPVDGSRFHSTSS